MSRYSWFRATWPMSMRDLALRLRSAQFTEDSDEGFVLDRSRDDYLEAAYVRKLISTEPRYDPFGREVAGNEISYQQTRFRASSGAIGLELVDSPRSTQRFVSKLLEICEFHLTVQPVLVDVQEWAGSITRELDVPGIADVAQIGGVVLPGGAVGRLTVRGPGDIRAAVSQFLPMSHTVEKLQIRLGGTFKGSSMILGRLGTAKVASGVESQLLEVLRATIDAPQLASK